MGEEKEKEIFFYFFYEKQVFLFLSKRIWIIYCFNAFQNANQIFIPTLHSKSHLTFPEKEVGDKLGV